MSDTSKDIIEVVDYDQGWPSLFAETAEPMRRVLGATAVRIDHIGSTAVPGLAAKPVIDVQISVTDFEPLAWFKDPLESLGYRYRADNPERTKRYFRESPGSRRTHVHVRRAGSFSEQLPLLVRDYLRCHDETAAEFGAVKKRLAEQYRTDRRGYTSAKVPYVWDIVRRADEWAQVRGWSAGVSDR